MPDHHPPDAARRAEALSSPLRWRVLRLCLHEPRTNAELAGALDVNPGTMLRHVRLLVEAGFLAPQDERRGRQGAREIPYLATRQTWENAPANVGPVLVQTLLDEIAALEPEELKAWRLGVRLRPDDHAALGERLDAIFTDALALDSSAEDALPWSLTSFLHPDRPAGRRL